MLAVVVFIVVVVSIVERRWFLHSLYNQGDIDAGLACLVAGALLFPAATVLLARSVPSKASWLRQHLWHSGGIYAVLSLAALSLIENYQEQRYGLGYGLMSGVFVTAAYAAALNAFTLWLLPRSRSSPITGHPVNQSR
jgi:hypothetical protein